MQRSSFSKYKGQNIIIYIIFLLYITSVFFLCFFNPSKIGVELTKHFLGIPLDKILHFILFFPFPITFYFVMEYTPILNQIKYRLCIGLLLGCIISLLTELIQYYFIAGRQGDWLDYIADIIGLSIATILMWIYTIVKKSASK